MFTDPVHIAVARAYQAAAADPNSQRAATRPCLGDKVVSLSVADNFALIEGGVPSTWVFCKAGEAPGITTDGVYVHQFGFRGERPTVGALIVNYILHPQPGQRVEFLDGNPCNFLRHNLRLVDAVSGKVVKPADTQAATAAARVSSVSKTPHGATLECY